MKKSELKQLIKEVKQEMLNESLISFKKVKALFVDSMEGSLLDDDDLEDLRSILKKAKDVGDLVNYLCDSGMDEAEAYEYIFNLIVK